MILRGGAARRGKRAPPGGDGPQVAAPAAVAERGVRRGVDLPVTDLAATARRADYRPPVEEELVADAGAHRHDAEVAGAPGHVAVARGRDVVDRPDIRTRPALGEALRQRVGRGARAPVDGRRAQHVPLGIDGAREGDRHDEARLALHQRGRPCRASPR